MHDLCTLWERIRQNDAEAWRRLVSAYAALVYSEARRCGLSGPDAEDCAQHAWLALYRQRVRIRDPKSLPAWLIRTTRRQALKTAARLGREVELTPSDEAQDPAPGADHVALRTGLQAAVEEAMLQLDPRCRQLLTALFVDPKPLPYNELAISLGVNANTLGPMRSRCLGRLKKILQKSGWTLH